MKLPSKYFVKGWCFILPLILWYIMNLITFYKIKPWEQIQKCKNSDSFYCVILNRPSKLEQKGIIFNILLFFNFLLFVCASFSICAGVIIYFIDFLYTRIIVEHTNEK